MASRDHLRPTEAVPTSPAEPDFVARSRHVFVAGKQLTLQDVRDRVAAEVTGTGRRDLLSALDTVARVFGRELRTIRAEPRAVRELLRSRTAAELGLADKRYANVRAATATALRRFGSSSPSIARRFPQSLAWQQLLGRIPIVSRRQGLERLASFASAMKVEPAAVGRDTLLGFHEAMVAEETVRDPRLKLKHTIALWNMCAREVPDWPDIRLRSPFDRNIIVLPLADFPASFRADLERWQGEALVSDPFDPAARPRPLRGPTVTSYTAVILRFASALVRQKLVPLEAITGLDVLIRPDLLKAGLRYFLDRYGKKGLATVAHFARILRGIAVHHCRVDTARAEELAELCRRLRPPRPQQMADRNRERLRQYDDPDKVARLLGFPEAERRRGLATANPQRAAKCFERALAVALLIHAGLRIENLRTINLTTDLARRDGSWCLAITGERVKNGEPIEQELPTEVGQLLGEFIATYRPRLAGADGPYLFPGRDGGPRPDRTLRADIGDSLRKRAGLIMTPHLFRHAVGKILIERDPSLGFAIARHFGHKSLATTLGSYLGSETRAAGRHLNRLLQQARSQPEIPGEAEAPNNA